MEILSRSLISDVGGLNLRGNLQLPVKFRPTLIWTSVYCRAVIYFSGDISAFEFAFTRRSGTAIDRNIFAKKCLGRRNISLKTDGEYLYIAGGEVGNTMVCFDSITAGGSKELEVQSISQDEYTALTGLTDITIQS